MKKWYNCKEIPNPGEGGGGAMRGTVLEVNLPACSTSCVLWTPHLAVAWGGSTLRFHRNQTLCPELHVCDKHPLPQLQGTSYKSLFELSVGPWKLRWNKAPEQRKGRVGIACNSSSAAWLCRGAAQAAVEFLWALWDYHTSGKCPLTFSSRTY